jgi:hypothetical protein
MGGFRTKEEVVDGSLLLMTIRTGLKNNFYSLN